MGNKAQSGLNVTSRLLGIVSNQDKKRAEEERWLIIHQRENIYWAPNNAPYQLSEVLRTQQIKFLLCGADMLLYISYTLIIIIL